MRSLEWRSLLSKPRNEERDSSPLIVSHIAGHDRQAMLERGGRDDQIRL